MKLVAGPELERHVPRLNSSAISRVAYDARAKRLMVTFRDSRETYVYLDVPHEVYDAFMSAPSQGRFFNAEIRDRFERDDP